MTCWFWGWDDYLLVKLSRSGLSLWNELIEGGPDILAVVVGSIYLPEIMSGSGLFSKYARVLLQRCASSRETKGQDGD